MAARSAILPIEMKRVGSADSSFEDGRVKGKEDSERKSRMGMSRLWTFSSFIPRPLTMALEPRREIWMR